MSVKNSQFQRCVVIANPNATHYKRGMAFSRVLAEFFEAENLHFIHPSRSDYTDIEEIDSRLPELLDENTLVCVVGGDGTVNMVLNLILQTAPAKSRKAVFLPLWGGNANDLAYMANGFVWRANVAKIIRLGAVKAISPLAVQTKNGSQQKLRLAACYVSFGASAYASHLMDRPGHRNRRLYRLPGWRFPIEIASVLKSLVKARRFSVEVDGQLQTIYDLLLINGSRIAKVESAPIKLTDPKFFELRTRRKYPLIAAYLGTILHGLVFRSTPDKRAMLVREATWAQADGEAFYVSKGTTVTVTQHEEPFYLLGTNLSKPTWRFWR